MAAVSGDGALVASAAMDARDALADLVDRAACVEAAVAFEASGRLTGSTLDDEERAAAVADSARRLLAEASGLRPDAGVEAVAAFTRAGAVAVVRRGDLVVVAVTQPEPPAPLTLHDLGTCLRALAADADAPLWRARGEDDDATR